MTTRMATEADIPLLDTMLSNMGQLKSEGAIREMLAAPFITVIHETAGVPDGFYVCFDMAAQKQSIIGPGDAPHESYQAWLKAICEMGIAINVEFTRRNPKVDQTKWWVLTRIWPTMGPMRDFLEVQFAWTAKADAGPISGQEGYTETADGGRTYWVKLSNLVARAKQVLRTLP